MVAFNGMGFKRAMMKCLVIHFLVAFSQGQLVYKLSAGYYTRHCIVEQKFFYTLCNLDAYLQYTLGLF